MSRRWTICLGCWSVFDPKAEEDCECEASGQEPGERIELMPVSEHEQAMERAEQEADERLEMGTLEAQEYAE